MFKKFLTYLSHVMASALANLGFVHHVEQRLQALLDLDLPPPEAADGELGLVARHLLLAPGAGRARPRLVQLFGQMCHAPADALIDLAAAAELIHTASLLHDDVVDGSSERRGRPTANASWGNIAAILTGDILLSTAIMQLNQHPRGITLRAIQTVATMSRAALLEVRARGNVLLTTEQWHRIAEGKTGALFGWCCEAPAWLGKDEHAAAHFARCGTHFGIAFQLADDLKDLEQGYSGKPRFADILNRGPSYPLLTAMQIQPSLRDRFQLAWAQPTVDEADVQGLGEAVLATEAPAITRNELSRAVDAALRVLEPWTGAESAELKDWIADLRHQHGLT